jgi:hypothetical protein
MFRIDPVTRKFDLFCEGTSNPWGIAFDPEGEAFISACVIDHLWHLTETGYYHRQGGPYPPHTWKIDSIVKHQHQMAAYCGITYVDSAAYPAPFRDMLVMGNIHGNCLNVDRLERRGATYFGSGDDDFLSGNDVWFMPVVQKVGPDGCLYVLDWYDRYHCYQDASADPTGVDRGHGRLYRIVHTATGRPTSPSLATASQQELTDLLTHSNIFIRETAQRLLSERSCSQVADALEAMVLDEQLSHKSRMHALWSLLGGHAITPSFAEKLLAHPDEIIRAWGVRAVGNLYADHAGLNQQCAAMSKDASRRVQVQLAIAASKMTHVDRIALWIALAVQCDDDPLIPHIIWQNLHPSLPEQAEKFLGLVENADLEHAPGLAAMLPLVAEKLQN